MADLGTTLVHAVARQRSLASSSLLTGLAEPDRQTGGIPLGSLVVVAADSGVRDQFALQLAVEALGRERRTVVATPFEAAEGTLERVLFMPYGLRPCDVEHATSPRVAEAEQDLADISDRLPLTVVGAGVHWAEEIRELLASGATDLLVLLDVDIAAYAVAAVTGEPGCSAPFGLRRLARLRRTTVVVTMTPAAVAAEPLWSRAADVTFTFEPAPPWQDLGGDSFMLRSSALPAWTGRVQVTPSGWLCDSVAASDAQVGSASLFASAAMAERRNAWLRAHAVSLADQEGDALQDGAPVHGTGVVVELRSNVTAAGDAWAALDLQIGDATYRCLVFPTVWRAEDRTLVQTGSKVRVFGRATNRQDGIEVHVSALEPRGVPTEQPHRTPPPDAGS